MSSKMVKFLLTGFLFLTMGTGLFASDYQALEGFYENEVVFLTIKNEDIYPTPGAGKSSHNLIFTLESEEGYFLTDNSGVYYEDEWYFFDIYTDEDYSYSDTLYISLDGSVGDFEFLLFYEIGGMNSEETVQIPVLLETDSEGILVLFGTEEMDVNVLDLTDEYLSEVLLSWLDSE